jgi:plastocyanin
MRQVGGFAVSKLFLRRTAAFKFLAAAALAAGLGGCGSSSTSSSTTSSTESSAAPSTSTSSAAASSTAATPPPTGAAQVVKLEANPGGALSYNTTALTAKAGKVTIEFTNMAPLQHNVTVESASGQSAGATPTFSGGTKSVTLNLTAGTYTFFCSVPGHKQAGMQGTLKVE